MKLMIWSMQKIIRLTHMFTQQLLKGGNMINRKTIVIIACVFVCISCTRTNFMVNQHDLTGFQQMELPLRFTGYYEDTYPIISVDNVLFL
jgi:hypothetical protein